MSIRSVEFLSESDAFAPISGILILFAFATCLMQAEEPTTGSHLHVIVGPSQHPPGTHEVPATARLLQHCLEQGDLDGRWTCVIHDRWPEEPDTFDNARAIVFLGDQFPLARWESGSSLLPHLERLAERGCGMVAIHYATGLNRPAVEDRHFTNAMLKLFGGYAHFSPNQAESSVARVFPTTITPVENGSPILHGVRAFSFTDEPYYRNRLATSTDDRTITPLVTVLVSGETPEQQVVAWAIESSSGTRGVAITLPHFFKHWQNEDLRRLVLNGIAWAARAEVPASGIQTALPDLEQFDPESVVP